VDPITRGVTLSWAEPSRKHPNQRIAAENDILLETCPHKFTREYGVGEVTYYRGDTAGGAADGLAN